MQGRIVLNMNGNKINVDANVSEVNGHTDRLKILHSLMLSMTDSTEERQALAMELMLIAPMLDSQTGKESTDEG